VDDTEAIEQVLRRYYRAHAAEEPDMIGHAAFAEPLLERILVEELGGDSFEQAFLEGNLLNPEDGYEQAAQLAESEYEISISGYSGRVRVVPVGPSFTFVSEAGSWKIASFE
jgi:hypothetical protein